MDTEQITRDAFSRQIEVLEAIEQRKGKEYAQEVARSSAVLAVLWALRREPVAAEKIGSHLDHASECVLLVGCMRANPLGSLETKEVQLQMLTDFTEHVKSVSRHMVVNAGDAAEGE